MNIFQLAEYNCCSNFQQDAGGNFQQGLDFIQKGIDLVVLLIQNYKQQLEML